VKVLKGEAPIERDTEAVEGWTTGEGCPTQSPADYTESEECCELRQRVPGQSPDRKRIRLLYCCILVAIKLMILKWIIKLNKRVN